MVTRRWTAAMLASWCVVSWAPAAHAWLAQGHALLTRAAVAALPEEMPAFFRDGADTAAFAAVQPDVMRGRATPQLHDAEPPEHYLDWELLDGSDLPNTRHKFLALCAEKNLSPAKVGYLPWAILQWQQQLIVSLAQHRADPDNAAAKAACLLHAGRMAHYAQDLCMPLHTTIHHDGRARPDGSSSRSGIHLKTDALPQKLESIPPVAELDPIDDAFAAVLDELRRSHDLVDRVYELESNIPAYADPIDNEAVRAFAAERAAASVRFTARLWLQAWRDSEKLKLPDWYKPGE